MRVTQADGVTLCDYEFTSFNKTTRSATLVIEGAWANGVTDEIIVLFIYFDSTSAQGDGSTSTTVNNAATLRVDHAAPRSIDDLFVYRQDKPGTSQPQYQTAAPTGVDHFVVIDITPSLEKRQTPSYGQLLYEEPFTLELTSEDDSGSSASVEVLTYAGFFEAVTARGRRMFCRCGVSGMSDGTNYTIIPSINTIKPGGSPSSLYRGIEPRFGIWGQDLQVEAP